MAHLTIQYSYELDKKYDFIEFTEGLRKVMVNSKIFPIGGIRIRCLPTISNAIADGHQNNRYVDLILRMGVGRTKKEKTKIGENLIKFSKLFFEAEIKKEYFALALEILEIEREFSWKFNSIHSRLQKN